jgi:hypothetical protein
VARVVFEVALAGSGAAVVGTVLVAGDHDPGDLAVGERVAVVVGLRDHRVHPLQHPLSDAGRARHPGRRGDDEDLGVEDRLTDRWPLVSLPHVRFDPGHDRHVDRAQFAHLDVFLTQLVGDHFDERLGVGDLGARFEGAVEDQSFHGRAVPGTAVSDACPCSSDPLPGRVCPVATIRTSDKQKFKVEVSAKKADEEIVRVGARGIPIVDLKLAGKDEMVYINATHIVSIEDAE